MHFLSHRSSESVRKCTFDDWAGGVIDTSPRSYGPFAGYDTPSYARMMRADFE